MGKFGSQGGPDAALCVLGRGVARRECNHELSITILGTSMNKGCQYARSGETSPTKKHPSELLLWQSRSPQSYASPAKRTSARTVKLASPHGVHLASYRGPPR